MAHPTSSPPMEPSGNSVTLHTGGRQHGHLEAQCLPKLRPQIALFSSQTIPIGPLNDKNHSDGGGLRSLSLLTIHNNDVLLHNVRLIIKKSAVQKDAIHITLLCK